MNRYLCEAAGASEEVTVAVGVVQKAFRLARALFVGPNVDATSPAGLSLASLFRTSRDMNSHATPVALLLFDKGRCQLTSKSILKPFGVQSTWGLTTTPNMRV